MMKWWNDEMMKFFVLFNNEMMKCCRSLHIDWEKHKRMKNSWVSNIWYWKHCFLVKNNKVCELKNLKKQWILLISNIWDLQNFFTLKTLSLWTKTLVKTPDFVNFEHLVLVLKTLFSSEKQQSMWEKPKKNSGFC